MLQSPPEGTSYSSKKVVFEWRKVRPAKVMQKEGEGGEMREERQEER
jgi:hypothetical protein